MMMRMRARMRAMKGSEQGNMIMTRGIMIRRLTARVGNGAMMEARRTMRRARMRAMMEVRRRG